MGGRFDALLLVLLMRAHLIDTSGATAYIRIKVPSQLVACPFCRELFSDTEATVCPHCDMVLRPLAELPPSAEAREVELLEWEQTPPQDRTLPWTYLRRGRGALLLISLFGLASVFGPWIELSKPAAYTLTGFELMRSRGFWFGGAFVSWLVMFPLVVSRRTITQMAGVRIVLCFLAATPLCQALLLYVNAPTSKLIPVAYTWGWGFIANGILGAVALPFAFKFGGRVDDLPADLGKELAPLAESETSEGQTLH